MRSGEGRGQAAQLSVLAVPGRRPLGKATVTGWQNLGYAAVTGGILEGGRCLPGGIIVGRADESGRKGAGRLRGIEEKRAETIAMERKAKVVSVAKGGGSVKHIEVVAAVIMHNGKLFAAQRGDGDPVGGWEFPGGKIEPGETQEEALVREIREELGAEIKVRGHLVTVTCDHDGFSLIMHCYLCDLASPIALLEHRDARWLTAQTLDSVEWLPADAQAIKEMQGRLWA